MVVREKYNVNTWEVVQVKGRIRLSCSGHAWTEMYMVASVEEVGLDAV